MKQIQGTSNKILEVNLETQTHEIYEVTSQERKLYLEAKGLGCGLDDVLSQPMSYVSSLNLSNTRYIITTDGANIFVYKRDKDNAWDSNPIAYLSINYLLKEYIIPKKTNPVSSLVLLKPGVL